MRIDLLADDARRRGPPALHKTRLIWLCVKRGLFGSRYRFDACSQGASVWLADLAHLAFLRTRKVSARRGKRHPCTGARMAQTPHRTFTTGHSPGRSSSPGTAPHQAQLLTRHSSSPGTGSSPGIHFWRQGSSGHSRRVVELLGLITQLNSLAQRVQGSAGHSRRVAELPAYNSANSLAKGTGIGWAALQIANLFLPHMKSAWPLRAAEPTPRFQTSKADRGMLTWLRVGSRKRRWTDSPG
jgi:hypothetical protein